MMKRHYILIAPSIPDAEMFSKRFSSIKSRNMTFIGLKSDIYKKLGSMPIAKYQIIICRGKHANFIENTLSRRKLIQFNKLIRDIKEDMKHHKIRANSISRRYNSTEINGLNERVAEQEEEEIRRFMESGRRNSWV